MTTRDAVETLRDGGQHPVRLIGEAETAELLELGLVKVDTTGRYVWLSRHGRTMLMGRR